MRDRQFELTSPLPYEDLMFFRMRAEEEISRLGEFTLECLSKKPSLPAKDILAKSVTVKVDTAESATREFSGFVTRFAHTGQEGEYHRYTAIVRPWLWFLTRKADCRIFQALSVPDIIKQVFERHSIADFRLVLRGSYAAREYCVQYRESDFDFVSRLMEEEGIYYFFEHKQGKHTMVLADSYSAHEPLPGYEKLRFVPEQDFGRTEYDHIDQWRIAQEVQSGKYVLTDYDFKRPSASLEAKVQASREHDLASYEVFDYPGEYLQRSDGEHYAQVRLDELQCCHELASAAGNVRGVSTGSLFTLENHPRDEQNREYLVVSTSFEMQAEGFEAEAGAGLEGGGLKVSFLALHSQQDFRPARRTPRPIVRGPQTAVVVGPSGEEIYTDEYGRIKVQFHWDRYGGKDENSSCWMRVAMPWAGNTWGVISLPRIGQEVVVDFLEGNPDAPLIIGSVYNAQQMPPFALPDNKTQSGVRSRSSKGGGTANFNEFRFEDKKGSEQVFLHAEKNQDIEVENDETHWVGHDRSKTIDNDETVHVKHDRTETVDNNETITIGVNRTESVGSNEDITIGANRNESVGANETISIAVDRSETVGANETITIGSNRSVTVGASETKTVAMQRTHAVGVNETIAIGAAQEVAIGAYQTVNVGANQDTNIGGAHSTNVGKAEERTVGDGRTTSVGKDDTLKVGKNLVIEAGDSVTIKTGSASITMKKDGTITIKGKDIQIEGSGKINVKASSDIVMKGSKILQN